MAKFDSPFDFSGKMGNFSVYKMKGSDKLIVRKKGGPTKKQVKLSPRFERTRENNAEFAACTRLTAGIRRALFPLRHLGDIRFTGGLNKLAKQIQRLDDKGERGQRSVYLSRHGDMLAGFNFNQQAAFDSVLRHPVTVKADRKNVAAAVTIPRLMPGISLSLPWNAPFYRFVVVLAAVGDVVLTKGRFLPVECAGVEMSYTAWSHAKATTDATDIRLQLEEGVKKGVSLVLAIGVEAGMPDRYGEMETIAGPGAAKILTVF